MVAQPQVWCSTSKIMPQDRMLLHAELDLSVERVRSHPAPVEWSRSYAAESPRWVLPISGTAVDIKANGKTWLIDPVTALRLGGPLTYNLRPNHRSMREGLVIARQNFDQDAVEPSFFLLDARTLFLGHVALQRSLSGGEGAGVLDSLIKQLPRSALQPLPIGAVARAKRLLVVQWENFVRASMHDIADAAAVSVFHLARSFKRQTGLSLHQYRQRLRLASVLQRLSDGERDLPGLAYDHGFCSQSHLGAVFHKEVGITLGKARSVLRHRP